MQALCSHVIINYPRMEARARPLSACWRLDLSQHAVWWPLGSIRFITLSSPRLTAGPLTAHCFMAIRQHQCSHFFIIQADNWTSLSKLEALSQSAPHLHFNQTARLKECPLSPDLWNGDICGLALLAQDTQL